jgi:TldD protein
MDMIVTAQPLAYIDHFGLTDGDLQKILDIALSRGGNFAEIYCEYKINSFINMEEDLIKETVESISLGMGIRVISGEKTGYGYANDLSFTKLKKASLTAASIASGREQERASPLIPVKPAHNAYPVLDPAHKKSLKDKIALVQRAYQAAQNFDPKIQKVKTSLLDEVQHVRVINSEGLSAIDVRPLIKMACFVIAEKDNQREAGYHGGGGRVGLEYFAENLTPEVIGREAAKESLHLLEAVLPPAGEMPVVLAPGHSGVLIHEAVGHLLEADFHRKKTSIFWDKMGRQIAQSALHIYDDPTIPYFRGSYNIDDEGTIPKKTPLIHKGKLVGLLHDKLSAKLMKTSETGHGRRQDFTCIPLPRMSNTYVDRGEYDPEEIIKSVPKGFYAHKYQGGQVEDSGKFTFSVSSGFLIEEGKLTSPVKQATLIGTNIDILNKVEKIGHDIQFGLQTGTCGKEGQAAPVTDGCPTLKITRMTVGGQ